MKYYPKSQIKTNLYTKGNDFITLLDKKTYIGYYWETSTGKYYTGKSPEDTPNYELIVNSNQEDGEETNSYYVVNPSYFNAKSISYNKKASSVSKQYSPQPTQENYNNGYVDRYFIKKNNEYVYIEISYDEYLKYTNGSYDVPTELYTPFNIVWYISGDKLTAIQRNQLSIYRLEKNNGYIGLSNYLNNKFDYLYENK